MAADLAIVMGFDLLGAIQEDAQCSECEPYTADVTDALASGDWTVRCDPACEAEFSLDPSDYCGRNNAETGTICLVTTRSAGCPSCLTETLLHELGHTAYHDEWSAEAFRNCMMGAYPFSCPVWP